MSIGNRIFKNIKRIDQSYLQAFQDIPVANIGDASMRLACLQGHVRSMNGLRIMGQAYTVKVPEGDNLFFYYAIDQAKPKDVIVVSGQGYEGRALCGEIMVSLAKKRQLGGFIVDGCIRDISEIRTIDFPVFARGVCPNGPYKNGPGEINVPVVIDGLVINPGDIVVGDDEGLAVIPLKHYQDILEQAKHIMKKEEMMKKQIEETGHLDLQWMYDVLVQINCEIHE